MKCQHGTLKLLRTGLCAGLLALAGCQGWDPGWWTWFDPSQTIRKPRQSMVNPIFNQIGPTDQTQELVPNCTQPTLEDLTYREEDYVIGPSDVLRITVLDLFLEGQESMLERQVGDSGYIDLPLLAHRLKAVGLTQDQLTEEIKRQYIQNGILKTPTVSVAVVVPRQSIFSILGAIARPGTYPIPQKKFTLMEGLAMAGDVTQINIEWIYVVRPVPRAGAIPAATQPAEELPELPELPRAPSSPPSATTPTTSRPAQTLEEQLRDLEKYIPGSAVRSGAPLPSAVNVDGPSSAPGAVPKDLGEATMTSKWVYSGGQWVQVPQSATAKPEEVKPALPERSTEDPFGWKEFELPGAARIIAINLPKLRSADPRMNIIVRNGDIVHIPMLEVGEFYVMGEVLRPGVYSLTGRRVTLKMAVAAAGNFGALSWPNNSVLIRRVGRDQEQMIAIHLNEVFAGREPDVFLKPDDVIAVGSHWTTPFLAVWRNAFRMTYGFGFIYDRNYSDRDFELPFTHSGAGFRTNKQ